jgi:Protein of unknown function (DUF4038)/Putative collagen-binding domain of a collagenase/Putative Ig domain
MRILAQRLIWTLLVSLYFLPATSAQVMGPVFVQQAAGAAAGTSSSFSLSFSGNTIAGDTILVAFNFDEYAGTNSVTDSQGNIFTGVGARLNSPDGVIRSRVYYAKNIRGGADTVTVTLTADSSWFELYLTEYSSVDLNNPIDAQAGASGNAGTVSSGTASTKFAGDVIYGYCASEGAGVCAVGSGFGARSTFDNKLIEDKLAGNPGSYAATGSATKGWTMQIVALKPASSVVGGSPAITSAATASGTAGSAFLYQITATNTPTSYEATGLPAGLSVNTGTGLISGTPTTTGTSTVTLSAINSSGTGKATLTLTVNPDPPPPPVITSATTSSGKVGSALSYQITATNTPTRYGATGLPQGLSVNTGTGLISGTPTTGGTSKVTLNATNDGGTGNTTLTLTLNAADLAITTTSLPNGHVGSAYSAALVATGGKTPYNWILTSGALPAGLSLKESSGVISGTSTQSVTNTPLTFEVTDSSSPALTQMATLRLTIGSAQSQFIAVSSNGKYLVNASGQPVFVTGEDGFLVDLQITPANATVYLNDRASRGFNAIWVGATDQLDQNNAPEDSAGNLPFTSGGVGAHNWFGTLNNPYWSRIDSIVSQAASLGITIFLHPSFIGNNDGSAAYDTPDWNAATEAQIQAYGTAIGSRYASSPNIVYVLGGDYSPSGQILTYVNAFGAAIRASDPNHLITIEGCRSTGCSNLSTSHYNTSTVPSWLGINWAYMTQTNAISICQSAYNSSPFLPPLEGEDWYENETHGSNPAITGFQVRQEGYYEVLSGCYTGRVSGNGQIWSFNATHSGDPNHPTWQTELSSVGSLSQEYMGQLFRSREHWLMVPDIHHTYLTAGYGSGLTTSVLSRTSDGQSMIAYIPNGSATTVTINMAGIVSSGNTVQGWWFNPSTAATTNLGAFSNRGTQNFTPPDSNDWVLVLDDASANLSAPGGASPAR